MNAIDPHILHTIAGETIEFSSHPIQLSYPPNSICNAQVALVEAEICSLKEKEVIVQCYHALDEFISAIFSVPKKDGIVRPIRLFIQFSNLSHQHDGTHGASTVSTAEKW